MIGCVRIYVAGSDLPRVIKIQDYDKAYVVKRCRENAAKATRVGLFWKKSKFLEEYLSPHRITLVTIQYTPEEGE